MVKKRQDPHGEEKFHKADKDQLPSQRSPTYLLTMLPVAQGDHVFNSDGQQEWEIKRDSDTKFAIYGKRKNNCKWLKLLRSSK